MDKEAKNNEGTIEWWKRKEKRAEIRKKLKKIKENKCTRCIWGNSETNFCMFPKCFEEIDKRRGK